MDILYNNQDYFIITSDIYQDFGSRFYGWAITDDKIFIHCMPDTQLLPLSTYGIYVNIVDKCDAIIIQQDFYNCYGLYIFKQGKFWAVSNSFYHLIDFLSRRYKLTLNNKAISTFMCVGLIFYHTAVNEIKELLPGQFIFINKRDGSLSILSSKIDRWSVEADSKTAVSILDSWHLKWRGVFEALANLNMKIQVELSGGMDSRASFAITRHCDLNRPNIHFWAHETSLPVYKEDYEISSEIISKYGFSRKMASNPTITISPLDAISLSLQPKFMREPNQLYFTSVFKDPIFAFTGYGGEALRGYSFWEGEIDDIKHCDFVIYDRFNLPIKTDSFNYLRDVLGIINYGDPSPMIDSTKIYYYCRVKSHFGGLSLEKSIRNVITLSPLMDPILARIKQTRNKVVDNDMLYALIYERYLPELATVKFDSGHEINHDAKMRAIEVSSLCPYNIDMPRSFAVYYEAKVLPPENNTFNHFTPSYFLASILKREDVKKFVIDKFNDKLYEYAIADYKSADFSSRVRRLLYNVWLLHTMVNRMVDR